MGVMNSIRERAGGFLVGVLVIAFGGLWALQDSGAFDAVGMGPDGRTIGEVDGIAIEGELYNRAVAQQLSTPLARAAVPGLLADAAGDPTLHAQLLERFALAGWGGVDARLAAAVERGEARPDVDAGTLLETAIGAALLATFLRGADALDDDWVARTAALLLRGLVAA